MFLLFFSPFCRLRYAVHYLLQPTETMRYNPDQQRTYREKTPASGWMSFIYSGFSHGLSASVQMHLHYITSWIWVRMRSGWMDGGPLSWLTDWLTEFRQTVAVSLTRKLNQTKFLLMRSINCFLIRYSKREISNQQSQHRSYSSWS